MQEKAPTGSSGEADFSRNTVNMWNWFRRTKNVLAATTILLLSLGCANSEATTKRVALVIGNSAYDPQEG